MKNSKNLFLTLIVMLITIYVCNANIIKGNNMDNEDNKTPNENFPNIEIPDILDTEKPLAGSIASPANNREIPDEEILPISGKVIPNEIPQEDDKQSKNPPPSVAGSVAGDIPPSWARHNPPRIAISEFFKSIINKFKRDKY